MADQLAGDDHTAVRRWFERQAAGYDASSERGLWAAVRVLETRAVLDAMGPLDGCRVLELGCGAGYYAHRMSARGAARVVGVDLVPEMVAQREGATVDLIVADAASVQLDERFDRVLAAGLLEFVPDPEAVLANARRHVPESARGALLVPRRGAVGWAYAAVYRARRVSVRLYDEQAVRRLATASGWRVTSIVSPHSFGLVAGIEAE